MSGGEHAHVLSLPLTELRDLLATIEDLFDGARRAKDRVVRFRDAPFTRGAQAAHLRPCLNVRPQLKRVRDALVFSLMCAIGLQKT